ncbi:hypothetical protein AVEN_158416-1 [Araneus ventricosus]|uniref:Uncharacterized protein n=1 Tax=Araneus ventricosus TaxID=182803 RepID=A0A4Y2UZK4_ARAVE|nr:hypothetical protein AVEN_158416-1 [Araneus ventricosus]
MGAQIVPSTKREVHYLGNDALFEIPATPGHTARLSDMAQRGQERRAEKQKSKKEIDDISKGQRSQYIRAEETEEQRKDNTFWEECS